MALKLLAGALLGIWLLLVLLSKGGFIHLLLLSGIAFAVVEMICEYRLRVMVRNDEI